MTQYRNALPQLDGGFFLTDGGIETTMIFLEGLDLPLFAAFDLLKTPEGTEALRNYYRTFAGIARRHGAGLILESATWRSNPDWGTKLGYDAAALAEANRAAIRLLEEVRGEVESAPFPIVISGCVGPRGDGYVPSQLMREEEAEGYHAPQIRTFAQTAADMITAITMNYTEEAVGIVRAARSAGMPVSISFTVETDGKLPTGQSLESAIQKVDDVTGSYPAYYMINCAHPSHFEHLLSEDLPWTKRLRGLRANASRMSHAELNEAAELDAGDPGELAMQYLQLMTRLPNLNVMGGCCGTDHRHVDAIAQACVPRLRA